MVTTEQQEAFALSFLIRVQLPDLPGALGAVATALGGIFGPPIVLLVAAALAILWVVMLAGHRRDANTRGD